MSLPTQKFRLAVILLAAFAFMVAGACGAQPAQEDEAGQSNGGTTEEANGEGNDEGSAPAEAPEDAPKNVIVLISDGMGFNHVDVASMYENGTSMYQEGEESVASQVYQDFPVQAAMATFSAGPEPEDGEEPTETGYDPESAWGELEYLSEEGTYTDSSSAGTAMATGVKIYDGQLNLTPEDEELTPVAEYAAEMGKATGVVSSVHFSHATPAAFAASNESRDNYDEIAQEMLESSSLDLIMGPGHPEFDHDGQPHPEGYELDTSHDYVGGEELWESIQNGEAGGDEPWTLIESREEFAELAEGGEAPERVLGVPQVYETLQYNRSGDAKAAPGEVPFNENVPTLEEMTRGALNALGDNEDGLFLMVEGGAVDWAGHANDLGRIIEEQSDFNRSTEAAVEWVEENSSWEETLLIVTADHETGYLLGEGAGEASDNQTPISNNGEGELPGAEFFSPNHTNSPVPLYANGAGSELFEEAADQEDPRYGPLMDIADHGRILLEFYGQEPQSSGEE